MVIAVFFSDRYGLLLLLYYIYIIDTRRYVGMCVYRAIYDSFFVIILHIICIRKNTKFSSTLYSRL